MGRVETLRTAALVAAGFGLVFVLWGARLLARARAAVRWTGPLRPRVGRLAATTMICTGLVLVAAAVPVLAGSTITVTGPAWRPWAVRVTVALVTLAIGGYAVARLVDRAELTALIRTPHVPGQPGRAERRAKYTLEDAGVHTDGQAGWVYRDSAGEWYLAVAVEPDPGVPPPERPAQRLIRLTDFTLVHTAGVPPPLSLSGSVEIRVIGMTEADQAGAGEPDTAGTGVDPDADSPFATGEPGGGNGSLPAHPTRSGHGPVGPDHGWAASGPGWAGTESGWAGTEHGRDGDPSGPHGGPPAGHPPIRPDWYYPGPAGSDLLPGPARRGSGQPPGSD